MNLQGRKIVVNKTISDLKIMMNNAEDYKNLMPEGLQTFIAEDNGFRFSLKGMPEIALKIENTNDDEVVLKSAKTNLDFQLKGLLNSINDAQTEVQILFEGNFNPFIKMMVEKPLQNFINTLTDKIEAL